MPSSSLQDALQLLKNGRAAAAAEALAPVAKATPAYVAAHVVRAQAFEAEHRWAEALAAWQEARFWLPGNPVVRAGQARAVEALVAASEDRLTLVEWAPDAEPGEAGAGAPAAGEAYTTSPLTGWLERVDFPSAEPAAPPAPEDPASDADATAGTIFTDWHSLVPSEDELDLDLEDDELDLDLAAEHGLGAALDLDDGDADSGPLAEIGDLDQLIEELEHARITPQPDVNVPPPELDDDIEDVVSETLARIYATQKQYDEAARVYEQLAEQQPERADEFLAKAAEMREQGG